MKSGDQIKAFVQIGLMKEPDWVKGKIIASNRNLGIQELKDLGFKVRVKHVDEYLVEIHQNKLYLDSSKVRLWNPLNFKLIGNEYHCDKVDDFISNNWEDLKKKCRDALSHFYPDLKLTVNEDEKILSIEDSYGPYLTIGCGVVEKKSIVAFFESPAWEIVHYVPTAGTRWEPPDVDERNCGYSETTIGAAKILIDTVARLHFDEYWQSIEDAELADSYEGEQW